MHNPNLKDSISMLLLNIWNGKDTSVISNIFTNYKYMDLYDHTETNTALSDIQKESFEKMDTIISVKNLIE